ncbi:methyl-accepting chemotaxis protein [Lysinibacillus yapensis]|uniref:Methyl-accepting chemotaxis protein n=1 Tax=Ureibacillus yapensis TaxID=2304605 RepID=A0A396SCS9_9BACL|nr:methyl-accepting chemotaxis protein [Lysinibacillus yapensis]RHW37517.1 methyl-accepting chemotaxis protein [Lysinibacillus yapensis]
MNKPRLLKVNNLKTKLIIAFSLLLIVPSLLIGARSYQVAKETVEGQLESTVADNLHILDMSIDSLLMPKVNDVKKISTNISSVTEERQPAIEETFEDYLELHPEVAGIYVGSENGSLIHIPQVELGSDFDARERTWYKESMSEQGKAVISDPYVSASNNEVVVTISQSLENGAGVVGIDLKLNQLQALTAQIQIGEEGYPIILDKRGNYIIHPTNEAATEAKESFYDNLYKDTAGTFSYMLGDREKMMGFTTNELTGWKVAGNYYTEEIKDASSPIFNATLIILAIALVIGGIVIYFVIRSIVSPLKELKEKAQTVSNGDLTQTIEVKSTDEIGQLAEAFIGMQESLKSLLKNVEKNAELVAASAEELSASSQESSAAAEQVSSSIQQVSAAAENQKHNIAGNVEALKEISNGATHIAEYSSTVTELTNGATNQAHEGGESVALIVNQMNFIHESVSESNEKIHSLNERSKQIDSIINIITDIAEQTNLLSLNASIEAARAGEHGKGFAVVADEVKKLAEQSRKSAKDIQEIIFAIQSDTKNTVELMTKVTNQVSEGMEVSNQTSTKFSKIVESMNQVAVSMEEVSATAQQVSASINETTVLAQNDVLLAESNAAASEQVAASAEQQLAAMEEVSASAQSLTEMAEELRSVISKFKF